MGPLFRGQPGCRMAMRIARHIDYPFLFRPAQHGDELECAGIVRLRCVVIVNQSQASSPGLAATGSSLFGKHAHAFRLTIKSEQPDLLRLDKSQIAKPYFVGW